VARFARHLGESGEHGSRVAHLALQLFDRLHGPLGLPSKAREWLEFAALLHDVGHHIGHKDHQHHSYYLITHGELLGFGRDEIEIIAQTARYHRKATPKLADVEYAALAKTERRVVRASSALLRIADGLDRTHYGVVRNVRVLRRGRRLLLQLDTQGDDAELEIWESRRRANLLRDVLGTEVDFQVMRPQERQDAQRTASISG
jgi:exopolyphosphatase/guanosine-5'-triphosphate,3'-diphosphate pyrophosphatase